MNATINTPSRVRDGRQTRQAILTAAKRLIFIKGYNATSLDDFLGESGVGKGSFYHYFASKEAFAKEVLELYVRGENERAEKILRDGKGAPLRRLRRYFEELIAVYGPAAKVSGCMIGNLSLEMADHSDSIQSLLHESFSNWQTGVAGVLQEAINRGDLARSNKPQELASFMLNSYEGALLRSKADRSSKPLENFLHFTFNVLLKG